MTNTIEHSLDDEWTLVASEVGTLAIQFANQGRALIHMGEVEPDEDSVGITIATNWAGLPSSFSAANIPEGASVWMRSPDKAKVIVLSY